MSDFTFSIEKIAGAASDKIACSIFNKKISLSDLTVGTFVGCVFASGESEDLSIVVSDIFDLAVSKLEGIEGSILENLSHVRDISSEFVESRKLDVSFVYAFFYNDVCYIARANNKVKVLVYDKTKTVELSFESGSGPVKPGQLFLIATEKFLSVFNTSVLGKGNEIDFADVIDGLATEISAEKDQAEMGAVFVQVKGETEDIEEIKDSKDIEEGEKKEVADISGENITAVSDSLQKVESASREEFTEDIHSKEFTQKVQKESFLKSILGVPGKILVAILREVRRLRGGEADARGRLRRNIVILAVVIILILAGSGGYTITRDQQKKKALAFEAHLATASSKFEEGSGIIDLNRARAREILIEADGEVKLALGIDGDNERAKSLEVEIGNKLKDTEVSANINFQTIVEISGSANSLSISGKNLIAADSNDVFEIDPSGKSKEEVGSESNILSSFVYDNKVFILTDNKVLRLDLATGQSSELFTHDGANDVGVFFGNVYLLSLDKISKYVPVEGGYSGPSDYLTTQQQFGQSPKLAIDGLVWVTGGNRVFKFNRGEKEDFEVSGVSGSIGEFGSIFTTSSLDNLYLVDTVNSALLVVDKDGIYKKAYQAPEFARARDFVISEDESKLYLVVDNKVLEANL